jgi:hypothetical protein
VGEEKEAMNKMKKMGAWLIPVAPMALVPALSFATVTIDPTSTLAIVAEALAFVVAVGLAILGLKYTRRGIKLAGNAG